MVQIEHLLLTVIVQNGDLTCVAVGFGHDRGLVNESASRQRRHLSHFVIVWVYSFEQETNESTQVVNAEVSILKVNLLIEFCRRDLLHRRVLLLFYLAFL